MFSNMSKQPRQGAHTGGSIIHAPSSLYCLSVGLLCTNITFIEYLHFYSKHNWQIAEKCVVNLMTEEPDW